jgi:multimeric flavodoxin WrbA
MDRREFSKKVVTTAIGAGLVMSTPMGLYTQTASKKKILGLAGSPRKNGNTDTLLITLLDAAKKEGAETEKIYLIDHKVQPCLVCEICHQEGRKPCAQEDDFNKIADKMIAADVIVIASPVHWITVSSPTKLLMDRGYSLINQSFKEVLSLGNSVLKGKVGAIIVCCNSTDTKTYGEPVANTIDLFYKFMGIELVEKIVTSAGFIEGEVAKNEVAMNQATELGKKLAKLT